MINSDFEGRCSVSRVHEGINGDYLLKTGSVVEAEDPWTGRLSRTSDALNEKDREGAIGY